MTKDSRELFDEWYQREYVYRGLQKNWRDTTHAIESLAAWQAALSAMPDKYENEPVGAWPKSPEKANEPYTRTRMDWWWLEFKLWQKRKVIYELELRLKDISKHEKAVKGLRDAYRERNVAYQAFNTDKSDDAYKRLIDSNDALEQALATVDEMMGE